MKKEIYIVMLLFLLVLGACGKQKPKGARPPQAIEIKPIYNIYMENSGSMDAYVQDVSGTNIKNTLFDFITRISDNEIASAIYLNFMINDKVKSFPNTKAATKNDIENYTNKMTPVEFKKFKNGINSSEISKMINSILTKSNNGDASIWISDCVFTPESGSPTVYLSHEKTIVRSSFISLLKKDSTIATLVLRFLSNYNGRYCSTAINHDRPYFIWIIGNESKLTNLFKTIDINKFEGGGVKNFYAIRKQTKQNKTPKYVILGASNYRLDTSNPKKNIVNAEPIQAGPNRGKFQFSIGLNLKGNLLNINDSYILDAKNYKITSNSDYKIDVVRNAGRGNYTHILKLTTNVLRSGDVNISMNNSLPKWVDELNSTNSGPLTTNDKFKTFGIKTLLEGVKEAYNYKNIFEINISINQ